MTRISRRSGCAGSTASAAALDDCAAAADRLRSRCCVALGLIIVGAFVFVGAVERLAVAVGIDASLLALIIAPIATELPEKFNSVLWVRQGKDTLAMGNITGAMVFQSTIPTVVALLFASSAWAIAPGSFIAFASAGIAFLASAAIFIPMARRGRLTGAQSRWSAGSSTSSTRHRGLRRRGGDGRRPH